MRCTALSCLMLLCYPLGCVADMLYVLLQGMVSMNSSCTFLHQTVR